MPRYPTEYPSNPPFVVDWNSVVRDTGHTMDWDKVGEEYRKVPGGTVTTSATASQGATSVAVVALPVPVPAGTVLDFGGAKFARVTTSAAKGATSLAVTALPTALASGDKAQVKGSGPKFVPGGTRMGTNGTNGRMYPRVADTNPAVMVLAEGAAEDSTAQTRSSYGVILGGALYENLMPGATGTPPKIPSAEKEELAAAGTGFAWLQYSDNTA